MEDLKIVEEFASYDMRTVYLVCPKKDGQKTVIGPLFVMKVIDKDAVENELRYQITHHQRYEMPKAPQFL